MIEIEIFNDLPRRQIEHTFVPEGISDTFNGPRLPSGDTLFGTARVKNDAFGTSFTVHTMELQGSFSEYGTRGTINTITQRSLQGDITYVISGLELEYSTYFNATLGTIGSSSAFLNFLRSLGEVSFVVPPPPPPPPPQLEIEIFGTSASERIDGNELDNYIEGGLGNDTIYGGAGDDRLNGNLGNEEIFGEAGNDTAFHVGNGLFDGGGGVDTLHTSLFKSSTDILISSDSIKVKGKSSSIETEIVDVEVLEFLSVSGSGTWEAGKYLGFRDLPEIAFREFTELYIAYFNRAPDAEGLFFWASAFANGFSMEESARAFLNSPEYAATYPSGTSNETFAEAVYNNVLGRTPDPTGLEFWVGLLNAGLVGRDTFILEVLRGVRAENADGATDEFIAQKADDVAFLDNKVDIGIYFSTILGMSDTADARTVMDSFDGTQDSIVTAKGLSDQFYAVAAEDDFLIQVSGVFDNPFEGLAPVGGPADGPVGDILGNIFTTSSILPDGQVVSSSINANGDYDWFSVQLEAGRSYAIFQNASVGSRLDSFLRLMDAGGQQIAFNDDGGFGTNADGSMVNSLIIFAPDFSGTFFVNAGGYSGQSTGAYDLEVVGLASGGEFGL